MRAPLITAVLRELVPLWPDSPPVLIGANALPDIGPRQTDDLDFVVAVEQDDKRLWQLRDLSRPWSAGTGGWCR